MHEHLTKSWHDAGCLREELQAALAVSSAVECLLLLPMIESAAKLEREVYELMQASALDSTQKEATA